MMARADDGDGPSPPPLRGRSDRAAIREGGNPAAHRPAAEINRSRAKAMRSEMTDAERTLWLQLRAHRLDNLSFRRQVLIGPFIADFVCHDHKLVIELDGGQHAGTDASMRDADREQWLQSKGYRVLRFWNSDVLGNLNGVLQSILAAIDTPLPNPPPQGGRGLVCTRRKLIS